MAKRFIEAKPEPAKDNTPNANNTKPEDSKN